MPATIGYSRNNQIRTNLNKKLQSRVQSARDRLLFGMDYRQMKRETAWRDAYKQYMNQIGYDKNDDPTADVINVNLSFSTINTLVPFVADENPRFIVEPYSGDATAENAELLQTGMNRMWESDEIMGQVHLRNAAIDKMIYGDGYVKVGYRIAKEPTFDNLGNPIEGRELEIAKFTVERVSNWDVWIDPYSDGIHNARWVCQRMMIPTEEFKNDDRYKVLRPDDFEGGLGVEHENMPQEDLERSDYYYAADGWVTVYEFYDTVEKWMVAILLDGGQQVVRYIEHIKCPIVQLPNHRIPNCPYSVGELENIRALQEELNKTRSQMITHRRRNIMKWMYRKGQVRQEALDAMASGIINDLIPIEGNAPLEFYVHPVEPTPLSADSYALDAQIRADINEITGVNEYLRGVPQDIRRTATEASIIEGATNVRTRHQLLQIETAARYIGQLLLDIMSDVLPLTDFQEMTLYITGREAEKLNRATGQPMADADAALTLTPETFTGKYVVFVERGSAELRNQQQNAAKMREIAQIMINAYPLLVQAGVTVSLRRIVEEWFKAEGFSDVEQFFELDQMELGALQMQMMGMMGGAPGSAEGAPTAPGEPRGQSTQPPSDIVGPQNSGMLPSAPY